MKKTLNTALTLSFSALCLSALSHAGATTTQKWGQLNINLESCFRASSGVDSGCNGFITNTGQQDIRVTLDPRRDTALLPDGTAIKAKSVVFGGYEDNYGVTQIIPAGLSVRFQLNYNITKGINTLKALGIGDAEFKNVTLAQELPTEPAINETGTPSLTDSNEQVERTLLDCVRQKTTVTCTFKTQSKVDDPLRLYSRTSSEESILLSRKGEFQRPSQVTLGGASDNYIVQSIMPARRALLNQATFNLPETDTFIPYLKLDNYEFRNLPITAAPTPRLLNGSGDSVNSYRLREYAATVNTCTYVRDGLRCDLTYTNRTDGGFNLRTTRDDASLLTPSGEWYGVKNLTARGETDNYNVGIPLPAGGNGTLSILFSAPAGLTTLPVIMVGGMTFENIPVK